MNTEVTVLMPVYNGEKYLREAIDSILNQTFTDFEFLIVNDGSTDATEAIILSYTDPRIKLISQPNGGVSKALNKGLEHAAGKYIARMDADDISFPERLQIQYDFMQQNPEYIMIGADVDYMSEEGEFIFTYYNTPRTQEELKSVIHEECSFVHTTVFYLKKNVLDLGGYSERAHSFEDHLLWTKLIKHGNIRNLAMVLLSCRFNASSVTIDEKDMDQTFRKIKKKALETGEISLEEEKELLSSKKGLSAAKKECSYNRMLGKKYLWNNYQPAKARKHLVKAIKAEPFNSKSYLLWGMSFLPETLIKKVYTKFK